MDCPSCPQTPLEEKEVSGGLLADVCPTCAGVWLDPGELEQIGASKRGFPKSLAEAAKKNKQSPLSCPGCSTKMSSVWVESTDTDYKVCPNCAGSWLLNKQLRDLRGDRAPVRAAPEPEPSGRRESLLADVMPSFQSGGVFTSAGAIAAYFVFIGVLLYSPPELFHMKPKPAPVPAPAAPTPGPEAPAERGPSQAQVEAMIQAAVADKAKPAGKPKPAIRSSADSPNYSAPVDESRVAVVVGVEEYADLPPADYAANDADSVHQHLLALGFAPRNVMVLTGRDATKGRLSAALNAWLPKHAGKDSTVFFYFSGHGAPDPASRQAYLVPADGSAESLADTAVPLKDVYARLGSLKAKHVVVALDSCFSGLGGRSVLAKGVRPLMPKMDVAANSARITVLSASGPDQISGTLEDEAHGAFTFYLLEGLNGAAKDSSGAITVDSLYGYLKPKVQDAARLQKREQTPQMLSDADHGFVLR